MRTIVAFVALALSFNAWAGPAEDAGQVVQRWAAAFEARDLDAIGRLYAPEAFFWGTSSKTLVTAPEGVREYFERAFSATQSPKITVSEQKAMVLSDSLVAIVSTDAVAGTRDDKPYLSPGRTSWLLAKRGGEWKIVQFHRSSIPR